MKSLLSFILSITAMSATSLAQGPHGLPGGTPASVLAMNRVQTITGAVTAVNIGYGMQYPSVTINKLPIKVAPVWYLLEKNFEIKIGDSLTILAAPSTAPSDLYLYAVELTNNATKAHIHLRDPSGVPFWSGRGGWVGQSGSGPMSDGDCTEPLAIVTETGTVEQLTIGVGIQMPSVSLKTEAGKLLVIKLGPERLLLQSDIELKAGDIITVKYALTPHDDELVALTITKGTVTVVLRGDDCHPAWS